MSPAHFALYILIATLSGATLGLVFSGWLTSETRIVRKHLGLLGKAVQNDLLALHERLLAIEQGTVKRLEAAKTDLVQ